MWPGQDVILMEQRDSSIFFSRSSDRPLNLNKKDFWRMAGYFQGIWGNNWKNGAYQNRKVPA